MTVGILRRRAWSLGAAALLTLLLTLLPSGRASACSCMFMEPEEALGQADVPAAFVGTVVAKEGRGGQDEFGQQHVAWTFEVEAVLRGDLAATTVVEGPQGDGANCGMFAEVGDRMGLLLYRDGDHWSSSSCSTYDADALLAAGEPRPPSDDVTPAVADPPPAAQRGTVVAIVAALGGALAVLGGVTWAVRRRAG